MPRHSPYALVRLNFLAPADLSISPVLLFLLELLEFLENMDIAAKRVSFLLVCFASLISQRLTKLSNSALAEFCYPLIGKT